MKQVYELTCHNIRFACSSVHTFHDNADRSEEHAHC